MLKTPLPQGFSSIPLDKRRLRAHFIRVVLQKREHSLRGDANGDCQGRPWPPAVSLQESLVTIEERIPEMTDKELENLRVNAERLAQSGASKQQVEAARLLPIIAAAVEERRAANAVALVERKKVRQQGMAAARARKVSARKAAAAEKIA